ncbi:MAG: ribonuclease HI [Candidatus Methanomethylicaceae archaeon]
MGHVERGRSSRELRHSNENMCNKKQSKEEGGHMVLMFDGLCEPYNPGGVATYGFAIYRNWEKLYEERGFVGAGSLGDDVSNNVAEYTALVKGMEYLQKHGYRGPLEVKGDSQLVIKQMRGEYAVRAKRLIRLHQRAKELAKNFEGVVFEWVPREENAEADSLCRAAYKEFISKGMKRAKLEKSEE